MKIIKLEKKKDDSIKLTPFRSEKEIFQRLYLCEYLSELNEFTNESSKINPYQDPIKKVKD